LHQEVGLGGVKSKLSYHKQAVLHQSLCKHINDVRGKPFDGRK